ncbi:MAG TPA: choice-of-anchor S family protein [Candidatus Bathyarchaeia archaeon]|nr:choice-of-anchor S family protein [Candidatus Bathyarchaeia archaeon]
MKKILILSIIFFLLVNIYPVLSPYNVAPNQTYEYDVKKAILSIKLCGDSYSGKGFKVNEIKFNQRSIIQAHVVSLGGDNVLWTLSCGGESESKLADWNLVDESSLSYTILNPISIIDDFLINPLLANDGLGLIFYPFLGTIRTMEFFKALNNKTQFIYSFFITKVDQPKFETYYEENGQLVIFESLITGKLKQNFTSPTYDISFSHHYQAVYNISIGLLQGSRVISEGSGLYMNKSVNYNFESQIELTDYNLPNLQFSINNFPQKWWLVGISSGIVIIGVSLIIIRYRKKK